MNTTSEKFDRKLRRPTISPSMPTTAPRIPCVTVKKTKPKNRVHEDSAHLLILRRPWDTAATGGTGLGCDLARSESPKALRRREVAQVAKHISFRFCCLVHGLGLEDGPPVPASQRFFRAVIPSIVSNFERMENRNSH
jgi:hypothetical protein